MNSAYFNIAFTPKVRAIQNAMGAPYLYGERLLLEPTQPARVSLSHETLHFIAQRTSFYIASTSETGWPYVQHKGGPRGFLIAINESTLAYPDFSGNRQYISAGNLSDNARAAIILTDYVQRRRLKLFASVEISKPETQPAVLKAFARFNYPAGIERIIVLNVVGFDWNCPSHIHADQVSPSFT
jgi:uncharacterized protein